MRRALTGPLSFGLSKAIASPEGVGVPKLSIALLGDAWNGLAIDFRDNSYSMRQSSNAEILLDGENGIAVDFPANEYAMRA